MQQNQRNEAIQKSSNIIKDYILNTEPTLETVINDINNENQITNKQELITALNDLQNGGNTSLQRSLQNAFNKLKPYQNLKNSFKTKFTQMKIAQSLVGQIANPKEFINNSNSDTPQIKNSNIGLLFSNNSNYQNLSLNIQPRGYPFKRQIISYNTSPSSINNFGVQDIIYTSLIDKNFMHSEPNSVVFWSKCDFDNNDLQALQQNNFWGPSFTQNIWGNNRNDTLDNRNAPNLQDLSLKGDQTSDAIAHSLNRYTLRDVWKYNIDGGTTARGINNIPVFNEMSRLLAERASGEVIFISGDKDATTNKYGRTWENIEKPTLMKNPDVTMIVEIDVKNPKKVKTIIFPHGITREIKTKYPIFASLKKQIQRIDYTLNPIQCIDFTERLITNPLIRNNPVHVKRPKSPIKPLQLRNSKQTNDKKLKRTNSIDSLNL